jgi:hypothetical protein
LAFQEGLATAKLQAGRGFAMMDRAGPPLKVVARARGGRSMPARRDVVTVLDRDFLETRCRILDVAAALDRLDRAPSHPGQPPDPRLAQLRQALESLLEPGPSRAETVQRLFSLPYDPNWQKQNGPASPRF